ncbi:MAG: prepilin-type N-terminal cleavage/methylation domain-containing protein [Sedimentisphaerales bacterium]|nr:prepilin-type N-terminal cleavage/methylation domain-containing protein [Sedimentisphaerales bacterium]
MIIGVEYNRKKVPNSLVVRKGFSLAEMLAAMTIGAMILVAVLGVYSRAERSAAAVRRKLGGSRLSSEVLQRIAEDLDKVISSETDTTIKIENKFKNGFPASKLTITRTIKDSADKERIFEEIVWQSLYDYESPVTGLVLYRGYSGMTLEDKVLDKNKDELELARAVPICNGVTFFKIDALKDGSPVEKWDGPAPSGITVAISFAEPFKGTGGNLDVLEEEKITRTIAIDRTRKINFVMEIIEPSEDGKTLDKEKSTTDGLKDTESARK